MFTSHLQFLSFDRKCFLFKSLLSSSPTLHLHLHTAEVLYRESISILEYLRFVRPLETILSCCDHLNHASHVSSSRIGAVFFD